MTMTSDASSWAAFPSLDEPLYGDWFGFTVVLMPDGDLLAPADFRALVHLWLDANSRGDLVSLTPTGPSVPVDSAAAYVAALNDVGSGFSWLSDLPSFSFGSPPGTIF